MCQFRGDRPRERGDLTLKKKRKKQQQNVRARVLHYLVKTKTAKQQQHCKLGMQIPK